MSKTGTGTKILYGLAALPPEERARIALIGCKARWAKKKRARCPCGLMTLKRAKARGRSNTHERSCAFFKEGKYRGKAAA